MVMNEYTFLKTRFSFTRFQKVISLLLTVFKMLKSKLHQVQIVLNPKWIIPNEISAESN